MDQMKKLFDSPDDAPLDPSPAKVNVLFNLVPKGYVFFNKISETD